MLVKVFSFFVWQQNWLNFLEAIFTLWLVLLFIILHIVLMRWCLKQLANDVTVSIGSELLLTLVALDWFAAVVNIHICKKLFDMALFSWLILFLLLLGCFTSLRKFCYCASFSGWCTPLFSLIGRFTLLFSFIYSCGRIPVESM